MIVISDALVVRHTCQRERARERERERGRKGERERGREIHQV